MPNIKYGSLRSWVDWDKIEGWKKKVTTKKGRKKFFGKINCTDLNSRTTEKSHIRALTIETDMGLGFPKIQ